MFNPKENEEERMKMADKILNKYLSSEEDGTMDPMIYDAMRMFIGFQDKTAELQFMRSARMTLRNELLTAYDYMARKGLLEGFKEYRG